MNVTNHSHLSNSDEAKRERIEYYRSALKYYQGRSLSLETILKCTQEQVEIPEEMKNYKTLNKNIKGLHADIMLLLSLRQCVKVIQDSLTCTQLLGTDNFIFKRDIMNKVQGIIYFSKSIMQMYREKLSEIDIISKQRIYTNALTEYGKHLEQINNSVNNLDEEESNSMAKAELQVYKINLIRSMKAVLIGFTSVNYPTLLPEFDRFRNPFKRNLTIEDFTEGWNVGLMPSST